MSANVPLPHEHALRLPVQQANSVVGLAKSATQSHCVHAELHARMTRASSAASSPAAQQLRLDVQAPRDPP